MKHLAPLIVLIATTPAFAQPAPVPVPTSRVTPEKVSGKAGKPIAITATSKNECIFIWDEKSLEGLQEGKTFFFSAQSPGAFLVRCITWDGKLIDEKIAVTIGGIIEPPPPPPPADDDVAKQLKEIRDAIAKVQSDLSASTAALAKRISALENEAPPPKQKVANLSFIGAELSNDATATNNSTGLRTYLASLGIKVHVLTADKKDIEKYGLTLAVAKAGGAPAVVLQDEIGNIIASARLTDEAALRKFLALYSEK